VPTILLHVQGMLSAEDEKRVEEALRAEPGVLGAVASRQDSCAEIEIEDDEVTTDHLVTVVLTEGFDARLGG